jgi:hypothetical protein
MQRIEGSDAPVVSVVFEATADLGSEVVTYLGAGCKTDSLLYIRAMPGAFESWIESEVPAAESLIDNGTNLPSPGVLRIGSSLIADLGRNAEPNWEMPAIRSSYTRPDMVSDPLDSVSILLAGKDVEADLRPTVDPLG